MSTTRKVLWVRIKKPKRRSRKGIPNRPHRLQSVQASIKAVIEEVVTERKPSIKQALIDGIESGPRNAHNYLRMAAEYTDGKPDSNIHLRTSFKEDEIADAQRSLTRKMDKLFQKVLRLDDGAVLELPETSIKSAENARTRAK